MGKYEEEVKADKNKLDEQWEQQPVLYQHYAELKADADKKKNDLKDELNVLKAKVELAYRSGAVTPRDEAGKKMDIKLTESTISSLVTTNPAVVEKMKEYNQAVYQSDVMGSAVEAFSHRKKALEKLVDLFIFAYHAEPKSDRVDKVREIKRRRRDLDEDTD